MDTPYRVGLDIYLRPLARSDAGNLVVWVNDEEVTGHLLLRRPVSLEAEEAFIDGLARSQEDLVVGIALRKSDRLIGVAGLHRIDWVNRHASFGIFIGDKSEWGKGFGTEATRLMAGVAFDALNLNRVWLHVFQDNCAGIKAYQKVGFRQEGVLRDDTFRKGRYHDTIVMGLLRREWAETALVSTAPAPGSRQ
jgi:[ribosomal protein S5]-alanine N-acetyltransferase